jgi:hypothetical protein
MLGFMTNRSLTAILAIFCFSIISAPLIIPAPSDLAADTGALKTVIQPPAVRTLPLGEHLVYDIFWFGYKVGVGEAEVREKTEFKGREVFHVVGTAKSNDFLEDVYPVYDEAHSWIDASTLESRQFEKKTDEDGQQEDEIDIFDSAGKKGHHRSVKNGENKDFNLTAPVHDAASAVYWVRRQTLVPGQSPLKVVLTCNQKDWELEINVIRRQIKKLPGQGVVDSILVVPTLRVNGILDTRGKIWVYLRNDPLHTPLLIKVKTPFGPVLGVLRSAEKW